MLFEWIAMKCFLLRFQEDCDDIRAGGNASATQSVTLVAAEAPDADRSNRPGSLFPRLNWTAGTQTRIATEQSDARSVRNLTAHSPYLPDRAVWNASTKTGIAREQSDETSMVGQQWLIQQETGTKTLTNVRAEAIDQDPSKRGNYFLPRPHTDGSDSQ